MEIEGNSLAVKVCDLPFIKYKTYIMNIAIVGATEIKIHNRKKSSFNCLSTGSEKTTTAITINSSEQVGIGTTSPNARLVISDSGDSPVRFISSGQATNYFELTNTGGAAMVFSNNNDLAIVPSN